jgi:hypothetical protein
MIEIKDILARFSDLISSSEQKKEIISDVISKVINKKINKEDIKTKNGVIYLNLPPLYKNEIFLKKEKIILELQNVLGRKTPSDIR